MKKTIRLLFLLLLLAAASFCVYIYFLEKVKVHVAPNKDRTFYQPDTTEFVIPVSISVKDIENLANQKLKTVLFDGRLPVRKAKDTLHLKLVRAGGLRFALRGNILTAQVPLYAEAYYTLHTIGKRSTDLFKKSPVSFSLNVLLETPISVNNHYGFNTRTSIRHIAWKVPPVVKLGPVKRDISEEAENIITKKEDLLTQRLDSIIRTRISLREPMEKIWTKIQKPVPLRLDKGRIVLYLRKQPLSAGVWIPSGSNDSLHLMMRLKGFLYILDAPDTLRFKKAGLPRTLKVLHAPPADDSSRFHVQVALPLKALESISNRKLAGLSLKYAGYRIRLKKINIVNGQQNILVSVKYKGDFNGEVRVKGFPRLDMDKKLFNINDLEFESREDNLVLGSAEKFFHNDILKKIKESVRIDMQQVIDTIPQIIQGGIDRSKLSSKAEVLLGCFEIRQVKTHLTVKYIQLMVEGNAQVKMNLRREAIVKEK